MTKKEGWVVTLLVQRKSVEGLSSTQSSYLEGALRDIFVASPHVQCQNIAGTGDWTLPEHEKIIMQQVVDSTLRIILLRGYRAVLANKTMSTMAASTNNPSAAVSLTPRVSTTPPAMPKLSMSVPSAPPREVTEPEPVRKLPFSPPVMTQPVSSSAPAPQSSFEPEIEREVKKVGFSLFGRKKAELKPSPKPEEIYEALDKWRKEQARVQHTKFWFILEDYTLKALSEKIPKTYDELLQIPGIKEKKREMYGKEILKVLEQSRTFRISLQTDQLCHCFFCYYGDSVFASFHCLSAETVRITG